MFLRFPLGMENIRTTYKTVQPRVAVLLGVTNFRSST